MAKWLKFDNFEEITRKARERVDQASKKPFFSWARKPKKNKYGEPVNFEGPTPQYPPRQPETPRNISTEDLNRFHTDDSYFPSDPE